MINKDFYPTPTEVISKMLQYSHVANKTILEPSAGSGNIVDYLQAAGAKEVIACEIEPKLRSILSTRCDVIGNDFLSLNSADISHVDMIVMNPPFSDQRNHILHAWNIAPSGCEIISLCNASMIINNYSYSKDQQITELINNFGDSENFGKCFQDSERETSVEVGWIRLFKPNCNDGEFDGVFDLEEDLHHFQQEDGLMKYNVVVDIVSRYVDAVSKFDEVMAMSKYINDKTAPFNSYGVKFGAYKNNKDSSSITRNFFKKDLQKNAWHHIFSMLKMNKYLTTKVQETINKFVNKQVHVPFTVSNVYRMIDLIMQTNGQRMEQALVEAFDLICSFSAENSTAGEKWKTNSDYKLNKKFIVPYMTKYDARWASGYVELDYSGYNRLDDINKALCYLTGTNYDDLPSLQSQFGVKTAKEWGVWYDWSFFEVKGFKKGTMHFQFKDPKVLEMFNLTVAKIKGWQLHKARTKKI